MGEILDIGDGINDLRGLRFEDWGTNNIRGVILP
jgi:hypothetical protein